MKATVKSVVQTTSKKKEGGERNRYGIANYYLYQVK